VKIPYSVQRPLELIHIDIFGLTYGLVIVDNTPDRHE